MAEKYEAPPVDPEDFTTVTVERDILAEKTVNKIQDLYGPLVSRESKQADESDPLSDREEFIKLDHVRLGPLQVRIMFPLGGDPYIADCKDRMGRDPLGLELLGIEYLLNTAVDAVRGKVAYELALALRKIFPDAQHIDNSFIDDAWSDSIGYIDDVTTVLSIKYGEHLEVEDDVMQVFPKNAASELIVEASFAGTDKVEPATFIITTDLGESPVVHSSDPLDQKTVGLARFK